jgi:predicted patatin/cPLA2 family phospholipase
MPPVVLEHRDPPPREELVTHPVIELMRRRKAEGSKPGLRNDDARLAVAIEGGGMRGITSAGMVAGLEELGLRDTIDVVYGSSAGSLNAAFLISGQGLWGCTIYYDYLTKSRFIDMKRVVARRPIVDMDYVVRDIYVKQQPLDYRGILGSPIPLHCLATDVSMARVADLHDFADVDEIQTALLASTRIPFLAGSAVTFRGRRYLDATLSESIPVATAVASKATHVLTLQTRPYGQRLTGARKSDRLLAAYLARLDPGLATLHAGRPERYAAALNLIDQKAADRSLQPAICPVRPPAGTPTVGQLEQSREALLQGAMAGMRAMYEVYTGEQTVVKEVMRAYRASIFEDWAAGAR